MQRWLAALFSFLLASTEMEEGEKEVATTSWWLEMAKRSCGGGWSQWQEVESAGARGGIGRSKRRKKEGKKKKERKKKNEWVDFLV